MSHSKLEYAIVDIETTGGSPGNGGITEIAILIHDGSKVIDRYVTLVNPQKHIPHWINSLTGITNEMVEGSPTFGEIADTVYDLLKDRVFVAHNVNFDFTFIKQKLKIEGYEFSPRKLCTVRMSRKIKPGFSSYSLGKLCDNLGIVIENRHRAMGDAEATAILFSKLLLWDTRGVIAEMLKKTSKHRQLPPHLPKEEFDALPDRPGVYYFHDAHGKVIYVGKALDLKKRVSSHFTGHNPGARRQKFLREIRHLSFEICATELMALLLECTEIKRLWPEYNRALKKFEPSFGIYTYRDRAGYLRAVAGKIQKHISCICHYESEFDAVNELLERIKTFDLDIRLCYLGQSSESFDAAANPALSAIPLPDPEVHNKKMEEALDSLNEHAKTYFIVDRGRNYEEKSVIWVEEGEFYGMGYFSADHIPSDPEEIRSVLDRYPSNFYMMKLIDSYAEKYPKKVFDFKITA